MRRKIAQHIIVAEYNPLWAEMFEAEAMKIRSILGENCIEIHHIGSTSIVGFAEKPIIDIMLVVYSLEDVDKWIIVNKVDRKKGGCN